MDMTRHMAGALERLGGTVRDGLTNSELRYQLQDCVRGKRVLYVLDNVQTYAQLDDLLPAEWGPGGVVIVTSRLKPEGFAASGIWEKVLLA